MSYKNDHSRAVVTKEETSQRRAVFLLQDVLISAVKVNILTRLGILNVSVQLSAGPKSTLYVSVQVSLQTFIMKVSSQPTLSVFEL